MARKSSGYIPPWMDLKEAIGLVKTIHKRGAGSVGLDDLASLMNHTVKSSAFTMKMAAMRAYGLVHTDGQISRLSSLGSVIAAPSSSEEYREAVFKAFNAIPLYSSLHQKYRGGYLPEDSFLANTLQREFRVSSENREKWVESFKQSGRAAGILRDEGGKVRVLQNPGPNGEHMLPETREVSTSREEIGEKKGAASIAERETSDSFSVFLEKGRSVIVPIKFDREDLEYLHGFLELYVKRRESKKE